MKKKILTILLATAVLSTTACNKAEYRLNRKPDTSTDTQILKAVGIQFAHQWTADEFRAFIETNGWKISSCEVVPGRIDLFYAECVRA